MATQAVQRFGSIMSGVYLLHNVSMAIAARLLRDPAAAIGDPNRGREAPCSERK